jgi:hypothetical protein
MPDHKTAKLRGIPLGNDVSALDKVRALTWANSQEAGESVNRQLPDEYGN